MYESVCATTGEPAPKPNPRPEGDVKHPLVMAAVIGAAVLVVGGIGAYIIIRYVLSYCGASSLGLTYVCYIEYHSIRRKKQAGDQYEMFDATAVEVSPIKSRGVPVILLHMVPMSSRRVPSLIQCKRMLFCLYRCQAGGLKILATAGSRTRQMGERGSRIDCGCMWAMYRWYYTRQYLCSHTTVVSNVYFFSLSRLTKPVCLTSSFIVSHTYTPPATDHSQYNPAYDEFIAFQRRAVQKWCYSRL